MYKKIFSAILFGVLTIASTSTFVSCKDYDDDINNLQAQIDELNNKKIAEINSTITELKNADANLQKALDAAKADLQKAISDGDAATLAAAKTLIAEAIADCQKACKENLAKSQQEQDAKYDEAIAKVNQRVDDIVKLLSDQDGNIQQVGKDLKALSDKLANFESKYGNLTTAFTDLTKRVTNLEDAVKAQKAALDDLAKTIGTGTGSNGYDDTTLKQDIKTAGDRITTLEGKVNNLQSQLTEKYNELAGKLNTVSGDLDNLKQAHSDFVTEVNGKLTDLGTQIGSVKSLAESTASDLGKLDVMFKILVNDLRSLVYMPKLYIDGIETIEYPYLKYERLVKKTGLAQTRKEKDDDITVNLRDLEDYDHATPIDSIAYGPVWPIQYHMNPGNARTEFEDIITWYAYEGEVLTRAYSDEFWKTRQSNETNKGTGTYGFMPRRFWDNQYKEDDEIWNKALGIMTLGLQIKNIEKIDNPGVAAGNNHFPSDRAEDTNDGLSPESVWNVMAALQAHSNKTEAGGAGDTIITSDYAQILPEKVKIEGIIWNTNPGYWSSQQNERIKDFWENKKGYNDPAYCPLDNGIAYKYRKGDGSATEGRDEAGAKCGKWVHVWDKPEEALLHPADIELYIDQEVVLSKYLGVHWYFDQNEPITKNVADHKNIQTWKFDSDELRRYGFVWVFDTVDYYVDTNKTHDSRYMRFTDHKTGALVSADITETGVTYESTTHTSVGREPLVRVRLYHFSDINDMTKWNNMDAKKDGIKEFNAPNYKPVLDGYIRLHITRPEKLEIEYPTENFTFDLCNGNSTTKYGRTNYWDYAMFNARVLKDKLNNMEKEQFDALYRIELLDPNTTGQNPTGANRAVEVAQYIQSGKPIVESPNEYYYYKNVTNVVNKPISECQIGHIFTEENVDGVSNHTYWWVIPADTLELLTHHASGDNGSAPVTITRWIHYTGHYYSSTRDHSAGAKYDDIFIKLSLTIMREDVKKSETSTKDENYWYKLDNSLNNWFRVRSNDALWSIANNTEYPTDGGSTIPWVNDILKTWDQNKVNVTSTSNTSYALGNGKYGKPTKFYFAPFDLTFTIKKLDGTSKTIHVTPKRGSGDDVYDKFICKWIKGNKHAYVLKPAGNQVGTVDEAKNNEILNSCAINFGPDKNNIEMNYGLEVTPPTADADIQKWQSQWPKADGVFSNDTLYAYTNASAQEYEPIAIIQNTNVNAADGGAEVILLHEYVENKWLPGAGCTSDNNIGRENEIAEELVNAVGRDVTFARENPSGKLLPWSDSDPKNPVDNGNPIAQQLRGYVGVIATNKCNIANQMTDKAIGNFAVFQMPWERPINIVSDVDIMIDAHDNADYIYMVDIIKLFDWRGLDSTTDNEFDKGYMWGDTPDFLGQSWGKRQWLWAYYNVKEIVVDLATDHVYTNLSETNETKINSNDILRDWKKMSTISNKVLLTGAATAYNNTDKKYHYVFDLRNPIDFNALAQNQALIEYMGLNHPWQETLDVDKAKFGYIKYENNGQNVHDFDVAVPVSVRYDWGWIEDRLVRIHIYGTLFNH